MNVFTEKLNETIMVLEEAEENAEERGYNEIAEAIRPVLKTLYRIRFPDVATNIFLCSHSHDIVATWIP